MNLVQALARSSRLNAEKTVLFWGEDEFSYQELWDAVLRFAGSMAGEYGVKPGDRVGVLLKNRPEYYPVIFGILHTGAAVVPINHFLKAAEIAFLIEDGGIEVLITEPAFAEIAATLRTMRPRLRVWEIQDWTARRRRSNGEGGDLTAQDAKGREGEDDMWAARRLRPAGEGSDLTVKIAKGRDGEDEMWADKQFHLTREEDLAFIIYTSGTTGKPKGAMLTHGNLLHNVNSCRQELEAVENDRFVLILPMFHSFMVCVSIVLPVAVGASVVLLKSVNQPKTIIQEIIVRRGTILPAIPPFFRAMTDPSVPADLPLRLCISGAAPLPIQVLADFNKKFSMPLLEGYGLSETSPVVSLNPVKGPWKAGSIGRPIADVEVRVRGAEGQWLPPGEIGEICVRGGNVMRGYWNQPQATAETIIDGWLLTGDVGYGDTDGFFFITDRKKDMLLVNGINVYPREIEELIYAYPGIREAAVVGIPEARKGEQPVAWISVADGAVVHEKELFHYLRGRLADYKVPRHIHRLPALPRNATGKILKTELRRMTSIVPPRPS